MRGGESFSAASCVLFFRQLIRPMESPKKKLGMNNRVRKLLGQSLGQSLGRPSQVLPGLNKHHPYGWIHNMYIQCISRPTSHRLIFISLSIHSSPRHIAHFVCFRCPAPTSRPTDKTPDAMAGGLHRKFFCLHIGGRRQSNYEFTRTRKKIRP